MAAQGGYIPRGFRQIPHAPPARIPHYPGEGRLSGGGSNPLRAPEPSDTEGQGDFIAPPNHVGGLIGLFLDPQRDKEYEQKVNARDTARQEKVQAGVDAYQQALEKTGDPQQAFASVFHTDSGGHVHFTDPPTFNAILNLHQHMSQGQQGQGDFETVDLGNNLTGIRDPNGKYSVHATPAQKQPAGDKIIKGPNNQYGTIKNGDFTPLTVNGQPQQPPADKPLTYKMTDDDKRYMSGAGSILRSLDVLRDAGKDAQGLIRGPAGQFFAKVLGTNDPSTIWGAAKLNLEQALIEGKVPGTFAGPLKTYLGTLPQVYHNERYDTTALNMTSSRLRQEYTNRAAEVEQINGGRPLPDALRNDLSSTGVFAPSLGWNNPRAMLGVGPTGAANMTYDQLKWATENSHMLSPDENTARLGELTKRAGIVPPVEAGKAAMQPPPEAPPQAAETPTQAAPDQSPQPSAPASQEPPPQSSAPSAPPTSAEQTDQSAQGLFQALVPE